MASSEDIWGGCIPGKNFSNSHCIPQMAKWSKPESQMASDSCAFGTSNGCTSGGNSEALKRRPHYTDRCAQAVPLHSALAAAERSPDPTRPTQAICKLLAPRHRHRSSGLHCRDLLLHDESAAKAEGKPSLRLFLTVITGWFFKKREMEKAFFPFPLSQHHLEKTPCSILGLTPS